jgi:hypothetical protein
MMELSQDVPFTVGASCGQVGVELAPVVGGATSGLPASADLRRPLPWTTCSK